MPPSPLHHATRDALEVALERRAEARAVVLERQRASCASGPAIALRNSATSATVRAIGPDVDSGDHEPDSAGTRPGDGRKPTTLQKAAGLRSDPPMSLPSAIGSIPQAQRRPPRRRCCRRTSCVRSYGFFVAPKTGLKVCDPAPNSGVFVLPSVTAPASRMRVTISASVVGHVVAEERRAAASCGCRPYPRDPCAPPADRGAGPSVLAARQCLVGRARRRPSHARPRASRSR